MNRHIRAFFLIIIIIMAGCEKKDNFPLYPENARLSRVISCSYMNCDNSVVMLEYEYDESGRLIKTSAPKYLEGKMDGVRDYSLYYYNSSGQLEKKMSYHLKPISGFVNTKNITYTYYPDGKLEKEITEEPGGEIEEYLLYEYDNREKPSKISVFDDHGTLVRYTVHDFDLQGRMIRETDYYIEDNTPVPYSVRDNKYAGKHLIKTDVYTGSNHLREINRAYDANGNLLFLKSEELSLFSSVAGYLHRYEYFE